MQEAPVSPFTRGQPSGQLGSQMAESFVQRLMLLEEPVQQVSVPVASEERRLQELGPALPVLQRQSGSVAGRDPKRVGPRPVGRPRNLIRGDQLGATDRFLLPSEQDNPGHRSLGKQPAGQVGQVHQRNRGKLGHQLPQCPPRVAG